VEAVGCGGLLLGILGVAIGIPMGLACAGSVLPIVTRAAALSSNTTVPPAELRVQFSSLILATALGLGTALAAVVLPAWRAAQVEIAETVRRRGVESERVRAGASWLLRAIAGVALLVAIVVEVIGARGRAGSWPDRSWLS
jgi:hypothetical protein